MSYDTFRSATPPVAIERRRQQRRRVLRGATISFNSGFGSSEGRVCDQSPDGARIAFGETMALPTQFDLQILGEKGLRAARVCWRSRTEVGVMLG